MMRIKNNQSKEFLKNLMHRKKIEYDVKKYMIEHFSLVYLQKIEGLWKYVDKMDRMKKVQEQRERRMKMTTLTQSAKAIPSMNNFEGQKVQRGHKPQQTVQPVSLKGIENIEKLLMREKYEFSEFWDLETDVAHNFKYYFNQSNPDALDREKAQEALKKKSFF